MEWEVGSSELDVEVGCRKDALRVEADTVDQTAFQLLDGNIIPQVGPGLEQPRQTLNAVEAAGSGEDLDRRPGCRLHDQLPQVLHHAPMQAGVDLVHQEEPAGGSNQRQRESEQPSHALAGAAERNAGATTPLTDHEAGQPSATLVGQRTNGPKLGRD